MTLASTQCPRCGYDQSGVIDSWRDSCPVAGVCPECGLEFEWRSLLNPAFATHLNLFEHAKERLGRAWWRTVRRTWRPRRFWRWIRIEHPIRPGRLALVGVTGSLFSYALGVTINIALWAVLLAALLLYMGSELLEVGALMEVTRDQALMLLAPPCMVLVHKVPVAWLAIAPLTLAFIPLTFLLLPNTFRTTRVRRAHLWRIWVYGLVGFALIACIPGWIDMAVSMAVFTLEDAMSMDLLGIHGSAGVDLLIGSMMIAMPLLWIAWWWYRASKDYLRLPRPGLVAIVLFVLALVASWTVVAVVAIFVPSILNSTHLYYW